MQFPRSKKKRWKRKPSRSDTMDFVLIGLYSSQSWVYRGIAVKVDKLHDWRTYVQVREYLITE